LGDRGKDPTAQVLKQRRWGMPEISEVITYVTQNQILLVLAAFLLAFLGYALVKRVLKMALFAVVFIGIYMGLVYLLA
jgi:hypothetical protein